MLAFIVRRFGVALVLLVVISFLTFLLFTATVPNPASEIAGRLATPEEVHLIDVKYGFNDPIYTQYFDTMKNIVTGSAYSYQSGFNVDSEIGSGLAATLSLAFGAGILWLLASIVVGTIAAIKAGRYVDRLLTVLALVGVSMPPFFFGAIAIYYAGYKLSIIPLQGYVHLHSNPWEWFKHLIGPWITLSILFVGFYSRVLRSTILDTINEDYVRTAKAKGLSERQVLVRHVLRNSLIPIISLWGLDMAAVIGGGAILTESVFGLHGVGELARDSIGRLDIIPILVIVMLTAFFVVLFAALVDILYAYLDPRIRLA
jgi:peptide/nickel transport system permease protein